MESSLALSPTFRLLSSRILKAGHALHTLQFFSNSGSSSRHTFSVITFSPATFG